MPLSLPAELKKVTPFIRRAEELDRDKSKAESRLVAYYCRQYAVHTGIEMAQSPAAKTALGSILNDLEKEKEAMSAFTREESKFLCRQFADNIFNKADTEDRFGQAGKNTAKTFYAAASFLEILQQFCNQDEEEMVEEREEISRKVKYAKWKSTEILKAIKEGRTPTPGGYGEGTKVDDEEKPEEEEKFEEESKIQPVTSTGLQMPLTPPIESIAPPTAPQMPSAPPTEPMPPTEEEETEVELGPPPSYPGTSVEDEPADAVVGSSMLPKQTQKEQRNQSRGGGIFGIGKKNFGKKVSKVSMDDAIELTRFALAALESKDTELAANRLKQALNVLGK